MIRIPAGENRHLYQIKNSHFIAIAALARTSGEVKALVKALKEEFPDATHVCHGAVLGDTGELYSLSDDGEPHGTAGRPILEVAKGSGLANLFIAVVRYFGGTKLGTGGLVQAYTQGAQDVLKTLETKEQRLCRFCSFRLEYSHLTKTEQFIAEAQGIVEEKTFLEKVAFTLWIPAEGADAFAQRMRDLSQGKVQIEYEKEELL